MEHVGILISHRPIIGPESDLRTLITDSAKIGTLIQAAKGIVTWLLRLATPVATAFVLGCSSVPATPESAARARADDEVARRAAAFAREMVGRPYKFGGNTPAGFDCSGLVRYSYNRAGIALPRATEAQRELATLTSLRSVRAGDLLFFDQEGRKFSHVGLYLGDGRFVHAPSSGGRVRIDSLRDKYWRKHFLEARRI